VYFQGSEELFSLDPLPLRTNTEPSMESGSYLIRPLAPTPSATRADQQRDGDDDDVASTGEVGELTTVNQKMTRW
jgi:hypothetical protein